jgi:hypothetical protein
MLAVVVDSFRTVAQCRAVSDGSDSGDDISHNSFLAVGQHPIASAAQVSYTDPFFNGQQIVTRADILMDVYGLFLLCPSRLALWRPFLFCSNPLVASDCSVRWFSRGARSTFYTK